MKIPPMAGFLLDSKKSKKRIGVKKKFELGLGIFACTILLVFL